MSYKSLLKASSAILLLGAVAACDDNVDDIAGPGPTPTPAPTPAPSPSPSPTPTPTPTPSTSVLADQFGSAFAAIFNRDPTLDPVNPMQSDLPPLAPADDPVNNPGQLAS